MRELILGGQRSGKSRCAERRAMAWRATRGHDAVLLVTAHAGDDEMRTRIARHRADRAERTPGLAVEEVPRALSQAIDAFSAPHRLVLVDCLTLWVTNLLMPMEGVPLSADAWQAQSDALSASIARSAGPVVLVSNEVGLGVSPMSREARAYIDALGQLHQAVAAQCDAVTLMVAGLEMPVKRP